MDIETDGLVIREYPKGERDKLLIVLTPEMGRISVWARGARSPKSPLLSVSQLLSYSRLRLKRGAGGYYLSGGEIKNLFFEIRDSIERLSLSQYFCELADRASADGREVGEILPLVLNSLYLLCKGEREAHVKAVFELRLMSVIGFRPELSACAVCGGDSDDMLFDMREGRVVCLSCAGREKITGAYRINRAVYDAMNHIINADAKKIFSFKLDEESGRILAKVTEGFMLTQLDINLKTLDFYNTL
ncbi:MAG: DNA repair protein RecO [Clostridia bacterium]|nr:DNA repair protein RecO [Clostridia bacterium]